jgi:hypothetical protein
LRYVFIVGDYADTNPISWAVEQSFSSAIYLFRVKGYCIQTFYAVHNEAFITVKSELNKFIANLRNFAPAAFLIGVTSYYKNLGIAGSHFFKNILK